MQRDKESVKKFLLRRTCGCLAKSRGNEPGKKTQRLSRFGGGWISDGQYLAEGMCVRVALSKGKTLPLRFWEHADWKNFFLMQLRFANALLKEFAAEAIINALRSPEGKTAFSLRAKWLRPLLEREQARFAIAASLEDKTEPVQGLLRYEPPATIRPRCLLSRLRDC